MSDLSIVIVEGYRYTGDHLDLSGTDLWPSPSTNEPSDHANSSSSPPAPTAPLAQVLELSATTAIGGQSLDGALVITNPGGSASDRHPGSVLTCPPGHYRHPAASP